MNDTDALKKQAFTLKFMNIQHSLALHLYLFLKLSVFTYLGDLHHLNKPLYGEVGLIQQHNTWP